MSDLSLFLPPLLRGFGTTLTLAGGGFVVTVVLAFLAGLAGRSRWVPVRVVARSYIETFRGTSALVQLFWAFYVLPFFGIDFDRMTVGIVVLGLNSGAYGAEIIRGAVNAVPTGQWEAGRALNFSPRQVLWRIAVPQAIPTALPSLGNILIELLKNTALVSLIAIEDLMFTAKQIRDDTLQTGLIFLLVLALYFVGAQAVRATITALERATSVGQRRGEVPV